MRNNLRLRATDLNEKSRPIKSRAAEVRVPRA